MEPGQGGDSGGEEVAGGRFGSTLGLKAAGQLLERVKLIPVASDELKQANSDLGVMFDDHYGPRALLRGHDAPGPHK